MNIIICGSITAADDIIRVQQILLKNNFKVEIPEGVKNQTLRTRTEVTMEEKAGDKIKYDLIRAYYKKIHASDIVLIVNPKKREIPGYIGGNTLIEMAFAHVLDKKLFCLYPIGDMQYRSEILAMQPTILHGDITQMFTALGWE